MKLELPRDANASMLLRLAAAIGLLLSLAACAAFPPAGVAADKSVIEIAGEAAATPIAPGLALPPRVDAGRAATPTTRADLPRLLEEGETAYRARRSDEAMAAFQRVVSLQPGHALAWLRIGNLHHQREDWFKALAAYRRAAARSGGEGTDAGLRAKALYNLALINLEMAQQTLRTLERIGPAATAAGPREPLREAIRKSRSRLDALAGAVSTTSEPSPAEAEPAPAPASVYRAASGSPSARRGPAPGEQDINPSRVDYFRGAPRP